MLLYRYLNQAYALEALQTKQLKIGRLSELNDPADCRPRLVNSPYGDDPIFEERYFAEIGKEIGVLCFSKTYEDPVIWSHYADAHRGLVLGYNFQTKKGGVVHHGIAYKARRPRVDFIKAERLRADDSSNRAFFNMVIKMGFRSKAPSWKYEQERRIFVQLSPPMCEMRGQHYFLRHLGGAPEQVIIGARCSLTEADIRRAIMSGGGTPIGTEIIKAKLHPKLHRITR